MVAVIATLAAIAVSSIINSRLSANEAAAIGSIRAIVSAEMDYGAMHRGCAVNLSELASLCPGMQVPFISPDLTVNGITKNGFTYSVVAGAGATAGPTNCNGVATQTAFYATAVPQNFGSTGRRGFAANANNAVWQDTSGAAPTEPFAVAGTVSMLGQ